MTVTVYGASDDLIEIVGDIEAEFYHRDETEGDVLAFSDGTALRIRYTPSGVWRITPVAEGTSTVHIEQATEGDEDNYSDRATLTGAPIAWVVHAVAFAAVKS